MIPIEEKPSAISWIYGILLFRMFWFLAIYTAAIYIFTLNLSDTWFNAIPRFIFSKASLIKAANPEFGINYILGYIGVKILIRFAFSIMEIITIHKKYMILFWILIGLDVLHTIFSLSVPVIPLIVLILALNKSTLKFLSHSEMKWKYNPSD